MTAQQRRQEIMAILEQAEAPLSAAALAGRLHVSRQIVVGDVALLRAVGREILATPRGYVLQPRPSQEGRVVVACRHDDGRLLEELYTVADCGCGVLDVTVEHPAYGQISAPLQVFSRADADHLARALQGCEPLCSLTDGIHLHTLQCPTSAHRTRVLQALREKGFLLEEK